MGGRKGEMKGGCLSGVGVGGLEGWGRAVPTYGKSGPANPGVQDCTCAGCGRTGAAGAHPRAAVRFGDALLDDAVATQAAGEPFHGTLHGFRVVDTKFVKVHGSSIDVARLNHRDHNKESDGERPGQVQREMKEDESGMSW